MADQKKRISELPLVGSTDGLMTLGVNAQNESVKVPLGDLLKSYNNAVTEAADAKSKATAAQSAATEAKTAANNAATAAQEAKTAAEQAAEQSGTALETANAAKTAANNSGLSHFDGIIPTATIQQASTVLSGQVIYVENKRVFALYATDGKYYNNWAGADSYLNFNRTEILKNKVYTFNNLIYVWDDSENNLVVAGGNEEEIKQLIEKTVAPRMFINANVLLSLNEASTIQSIRQLINAREDAAIYKVSGVVITFKTESGWESWQWIGNDWSSDDAWRKFGGSATVGNCYNVTNDAPLAMGYYTLETAIAKAYEKGYTTVGIQITFAIGEMSWKTYQYIGADSSQVNFNNPNNWLDLAGMSAGDEMLINVDYLCGACTAASFYTLEYAIAAIKNLQTSTGITYAKSGLVITYKTADNTWETKQFKGEPTDFGEAALWQDFGGGASTEIETKDEPEEGGKDAFSTGGAYDLIPTDLNVNTEEEGVIKIAMVNAKGETVGNEQQFAVGTGSGESSGTIVTIIPESSPLYGQAGGSIILNAAIRSVTTQGGEELANLIERVELYDRDTNQILETYRLNQASSADNETFDFSFDLSAYFSQASQRKFRLIAYDDSEHSGSRNINVTAVDVTIKSEQTLNYTASTVIQEGGAIKSLPMYRFPNNASDKGILCTTEIYLNSEWKELGTATVSDTYSHSVSINPNNCLGTVLKHGAYPLRIHGVDIASGVVGNYLYTAVMVVEQSNTTPIVVTRWLTEKQTAEVKQYETISMDFAAYNPLAQQIEVEIIETIGQQETVKQTTLAYRSMTYTYTQRVSGYQTDGSVTINLKAKADNQTSATASFKVSGTLLDIEPVTAQLMVDMDMSGRSNADADKSITDNGYTLSVIGANYSTNGFVKDSFGTEEYGTENDSGLMALRIAENVKASLDYAPFNQAAIETNGLAVQFRIRVRHVADDEARLISCIANGFGFYVTGKNVVFTTDNAATVAHTITSAIKDDSITDVAIVIEPTSQAPYAGIGVAKMYFDGELIGACYYDSGTLGRHATPISFDGTDGDLYLYNIRAWETYYSFEQSFDNYLLKLADADSMITEYNYNQVMASQSAEGKPATNRPQAASLFNIGIPYFVLCKNASTANTSDNYPDYLESLDGDKKTTRILDVYAYFPDRPWQDFKAIGVTVSNQGTTSSMRPIKNIKMKLKAATITLLHDRSEFSGDDLLKYDECATNAANHRVQPIETSVPTNIITVKVDYSESGGANNGASTQLFNELQRALGANYMTPAQNAYTGKYVLNTSIDSIPCAFFRTDEHSSDATSPSYGYFHAKGNWNDDKGDAAVFGFEDVEGYNEGCLNYGDFIELIAAKNQILSDFNSSIDKGEWDTSEVYVLSEFCGPNHMVFRYQDGAWKETTGTMTYTGGRWRITGDVVNPVENYELLAYNAMDWFQGVKSVDDMLAPKSDDDSTPVWLNYFESRYPDNDDLNQAYEDGRKVPYSLYKWLEWCEQCNQNLTEADGNIMLDESSVSGTTANRLLKFKHELHKVANVHSMICYHIFTDYIAAVDQRSKNMMVGFYLDTDGVTRMYLNHLYDGDTILGSDNDCGLTIPAELDPNNDPNGYYQGHDSVLFTQLAKSDYIWLKDYVSDSDTADTTKTVTVASIAATMRSLQLESGLRPFSPEGIRKYWITDRLQKWPKLVSSYDGIRKYIEHSKSSDNYFYALHGLSIQRLEDYVATRFLYRDGYYQCGDTFSSAISMRCTGTNMSVTIKAAKAGFFGIGVDQASSARESVYLDEGESATLHSGNTNLGSGVMLYIYGAERIAELDIRNATPKQSGWDISELTLIKKLIIGGDGYSPATNTGEELNTLNLGQLPFLEELDVRNFPIKAIDATYCPRLKKLLAKGSSLQTFTPAETSPIDTMQLPETMTALSLVNLPNLTYPNGGLTIEGVMSIQRLQLSGCSGIDAMSLLTAVVGGGASVKEISMPDLEITADTTILDALKASGAKGIGSDLDNACDGLTGQWILTHLIEDTAFYELADYFPALDLHNAQFTMVVFDDTVNDPKNITNLDNNTTGESYEASGHILKIREKLIPVKGKLEASTGKWKGERISESNYQQLADGTEFDYKDELGDGFDVFMRCPALWYKGINDFKNQKKYIAWSSLTDEPLSTAHKTNRKQLKNIVRNENMAIIITDVTPNESTLETSGVLTETPSYNVYQLDVEGMKQVRWPGLNNSAIGAVFLNAQGIIISKYNMAVSGNMFDFIDGDYIFIDVPSGAKTFAFTALAANAELEAIAVDSSEIEAIEPDWVHNMPWLGGVYEASVDNLRQLRSVSGATVQRGNGTSATSTEWTYEDDGTPKNTPVGTLNYTYKDFMNLAMRRGKGFQLIDYEMSKLMAILWYSLNGTRDAQLMCGYGKGAGGTTGYTDALGNADSDRTIIGSNGGNKVLGFESFMACTWEVMDNVAVNVPSWENYKKDRCVENNAYPLDAVWHIYDPIAKTEREVQGLNSNSGYCIGRVRHGRYCDIIASKTTTDNSVWASNYCDANYYTDSRGRVVGRAYHSAYANGGLACAYAFDASSRSSTGHGSRLAFRGEIEITNE